MKMEKKEVSEQTNRDWLIHMIETHSDGDHDLYYYLKELIDYVCSFDDPEGVFNTWLESDLEDSKNENSNVVKTSVQFRFALRRHTTISPEEYEWLCEAVKSASYNLYSRYRVKINRPIMVKGYFNSYCISELEIPKYLYSNFNIGNHLRGVSAYLLKNHPNHFKPLLVGKRLLFYIEWRKSDKEEEK